METQSKMIYLQCGMIKNLKGFPVELHNDGKIQLISQITCVCEDARLCPKPLNKLTTDKLCFIFDAPAQLRAKIKISLPDAEKEVLA